MKKTTAHLQKITTILTLGVLIAYFQNCSPPAVHDVGSASTFTFSEPILYSELDTYIFQPKCAGCHTAGTVDFTSYTTLMAGPSVVAGNLSTSSLYQQVANYQMPTQGGLNNAEIDAIAKWISAGAHPDIPLPTNPPSAPTGLIATATSPTSVMLVWNLLAAEVTGVLVERSAASTGPFAVVTSLTSAATTYTDMSALPSTTYYYRVSASNSNGSSAYSNTASVTTSALPLPAAPSGLTATAASASQINLSWVDNSNDETGFKIERAAAMAGPFTLLTTLAAGATSYANTGLTASTTYYYRTYAYSDAGSSSYSTVANATTQAVAATVPQAPSNLNATASSATQINLTWADNSNDETGFKIERAAAMTGPFTLLTTLAAGATSYANTGLTASTTYYYRTYAYNGVGNSGTSAVASVATLAAPPAAPTAPSGLTAAPSSGSQINLAWVDNSNNETGFKIERATASAGPFTLVTTVASGATSYSNTALAAATNYYYRVYAYSDTAGNSANTSVAAAMTYGTYTWFNSQINQSRCVSCHSAASPDGGYDMTTYAKIMTRVVTSNALGSKLYQTMADGSMPKGTNKLTADQLKAVRTWIDTGAANN